MNSTRGQEERDAAPPPGETRWRRVYLSVIVFTVLVIAALWLFSKTFSS